MARALACLKSVQRLQAVAIELHIRAIAARGCQQPRPRRVIKLTHNSPRCAHDQCAIGYDLSLRHQRARPDGAAMQHRLVPDGAIRPETQVTSRPVTLGLGTSKSTPMASDFVNSAFCRLQLVNGGEATGRCIYFLRLQYCNLTVGFPPNVSMTRWMMLPA